MASMKLEVSHLREDESIEAKTLWFKSLSLEDRMGVFCSLTEIALELNPGIKDVRNAQSAQGRVRVLSTA